MDEKLEKLRRRIEEVKAAPAWLKLQRAEAALNDALDLIEDMVKEFRRV